MAAFLIRSATVFSYLCFYCLAVLVAPIAAQSSSIPTGPQDSLPREHRRVERHNIPGRRADLTTLKGATLYIGPGVKPHRPMPLFVHFHGAPWLVEQHIYEHLPGAVLITVQLGAGSSVYGRPFAEDKIFGELVAEAERLAGAKTGWSSITLSGFSAGYGAIRAILRHKADFDRVSGVLLLDGFHASYEPQGKPLSDGGRVSPRDIDSFLEFAREAVSGRKYLVITHSQIHPGLYASTTECSNELLRELAIMRRMAVSSGPNGMKLLSLAKRNGLRVFGYAGETAADHVDHLHAMPFWFGYLGVR